MKINGKEVKPSHFLYGIANTVNGKMYVGQTNDIDKRKGEHYNNKNNGSKLVKQSISKYGKENLYHGVIAECYCLEEVQALEMFAIKHIHTRAPNGYNLTNGGEGCFGLIHSDETRKKLSELAKGRIISEETRKKLSEAGKGRVWSDESRKKLSEAGKSRVWSDEYRRKLSEANKSRVWSDESRKKLSESKSGLKASDETRNKMSESRKGIKQPVVICPHCGKEGGAFNMKRYHFDNCKHK